MTPNSMIDAHRRAFLGYCAFAGLSSTLFPVSLLPVAESLRDVVENVRPCRECFNLTEGELCSVCRDQRRDAGIICVVEAPRDVALFERAGGFRVRRARSPR